MRIPDDNSTRRSQHSARRPNATSSTRTDARLRTVAPEGDNSSPRDTDQTQSRRAQETRQAAHDAHGFKTRGHSLHSHQTRHRVPDLEALEEAARRRREKVERRRRSKRRAAQTLDASHNTANAPRKSRRWIALGVGVLAVGCGALALTRPEFNVSRVSVEGARLTDAQVLRRVQSSITGQNIVRADLRRSEKFLRTQAPVESVQVQRLATWPPQVMVSIQERTPFARVGGGDSWWIVDRAGVPFRRENVRDADLQAIHHDVWKPVLGEKLPPASWQKARDFVTLLAQEKREGHDWSLRRIYFDEHDFASVRLASGTHRETLVQLGNDDWRRKLARARETFAYFDKTGRRARTLNLITYAVPVYTPIVPPQSEKRRADAAENEASG